MIREVQRIDSISINNETYTVSFAGITVPLSLVSLTDSIDAGRRRLTLKYNGDTYVLRSYATNTDDIKAFDPYLDSVMKDYANACKKQASRLKKQEKKESRKNNRFALMKQQMKSMQDNALHIDKRNGRVRFAGNEVSALDIRMNVAEYGDMKRLTIEYNNQLFSYAPPTNKGKFSRKLINAHIDKIYNDYLKARERALT